MVFKSLIGKSYEKKGLVLEPISGNYNCVKPCPFCGSEDIDVKDTDYVVLKCSNCGATGPTWDYRVERAIDSWNNR